ncbi:PLP-dependent aminotransferase family protein [Oceaniglobus ichthyenteri]|uniref:MocR-like pyridoxine biosynthesis transcription factor PdxR n=1 Tax=Oceaniglobus ichthyenteri TaxID=2136177 RepID=UPI000D393926|nr:PLP-dependent aminotransferase family protein [Oceaniglobus ichthyenteri]
MPIAPDTFFFDPRAEGTLQKQIQTMVAAGILSGRFRPGERLPSSRQLAKHLGVSRITVTLAFTELLADDYLTAKGRSGYFVSENAPQPHDFTPAPRIDKVDWTRALGQRFSGGSGMIKPADWQKYRFPFIYGQTDPTLFDHANWRQCAVQALGQRDFGALTADYYESDDPKLVEFIARHSLPRRGILAEPNEILITMGAQNALWLAAQVLLTQRRRAAFEDPCYPALRDILLQSRCNLQTIPVDCDGLVPELVPPDTNVVFTTPSHQCPTTATMPLARRRALLERAAAHDMLIVEDDYEFEMSFLKSPSPALKSLDTDGRVIYVGSFSKSLFPGLRLGYLVGSAPFIREARALRSTVLRHVPGHIQRTTAYFLSLGHYDAQLRRMDRAYHDRRREMESAIAEAGLTVAGRGSFGGSSLWMRAPDRVDMAEIAQTLRAESVLIEPGHPFFASPDGPRNFYRLAYSSIPTPQIRPGILRIARHLQS